MGSCFSKCRTKKPKSDRRSTLQSDDHVHEKAVISLSLASRPMLPHPAPPSPSKSITLPSSFCVSSDSCMTTSCSSNSSSTSTSKDQSFSNEFLWSCALKNPHIIKPSSPVKLGEKVAVVMPPANNIIPEKRALPGSPNLTRQKSFRTDHFDFSCGPLRMATARTRSPSPSRRFEGDSRMCSSPRTNFVQPSLRKQCSFRTASPGHNIGKKNNWGGKQCSMVTGSPLLCPQADQPAAVKSVISGRDDMHSAEDIYNPLISLDCFIFL